MNSHDQIAMTTGTELEDVKTSNSVPTKANGNSNEESRGVKTSNLHPAGISNDWNEYFNSVLSESFNRLLHSKSLSDIAEVFKYAGKETGNKEFVTAVLLFQIYEITKKDKAYLSNRCLNPPFTPKNFPPGTITSVMYFPACDPVVI